MNGNYIVKLQWEKNNHTKMNEYQPSIVSIIFFKYLSILKNILKYLIK